MFGGALISGLRGMFDHFAVGLHGIGFCHDVLGAQFNGIPGKSPSPGTWNRR